MTWFEKLTGCPETTADIAQQLSVDGPWLHSAANGRTWRCGTLETPRLADLREAVAGRPTACELRLQEVVASVQILHRDPASAGTTFQVASQFNLLEMVAPSVTPERGIGIYESDLTQGPACAIAAGAGTIYRNYFVPVDGQTGQTATRQLDCLSDVGDLLGNSDGQLWEMRNGYALPTEDGLATIDRRLRDSDEAQHDALRAALRVGVQRGTQVTLGGSRHTVCQVLCSALPVSYAEYTGELWARFATLILEAAYEATLCAAMLNADQTGQPRLYLTLLGGGAFGNDFTWITAAILRACQRYRHSGLDVAIVSFGRSQPAVQALIRDFHNG